MKEEKQTLSEPMACCRSVENQSRLTSVCEDRAGWACLLSPSIFSFFPSFFFRFLSDNLTHARWPETEAGTRRRTKYKEQTHTHTHTTEGPVHSGSALKKSLSHASLSFLLSVIQRGLFSHTWMNSGLAREQAIDRHAARHERVIEELARQQHHHKKRIKS